MNPREPSPSAPAYRPSSTLSRRDCLLRLVQVTTAMATSSSAAATSGTRHLFVSSFAAGKDGGIQCYGLDERTGALTPLRRTGGVEHPFFLARDRSGRFLYSIHGKEFSGRDPEFVAAFRISGSQGELQPLNRQTTRGTASCFLDVDATRRTLLVANYTTGSVASLPIAADGSLGSPAAFLQHTGSSVHPERQREPHPHAFVISPDNRHAYVPDLGLDQILCYRLDPRKAQLQPARQPFVRTAPGSGPRHLAFHPGGKRLYVINELANSVTHFDHDPRDGMLVERQTLSTLPPDFRGVSHCADLKITPDGRFLYGTNRGHDSLACYRLDEDGRLTLLEIRPSLGAGPQNLAITPDGRWLLCANMPGNNLAVFRIREETGRLEPTGEPIAQKSPSCIVLL